MFVRRGGGLVNALIRWWGCEEGVEDGKERVSVSFWGCPVGISASTCNILDSWF